ncbi:ribbon-helix-helix domain-containing protein [Marilutibacter chinensis]|uniref:ribbon-helix-helix domain-containing protein n=1 Tax=Marilutibacter chinensis TaxID=2912247 RepID=UPI003CCCC0CF
MLPLRNPRLDQPTGRLPTAHVDARDAEQLRQLADQAGISMPEALRQILALYFRQPFLLSPKRMAHAGGDRLPQTKAPQHIVEGIDTLAKALGLTRGEVMRQIVRGTLKKHHALH